MDYSRKVYELFFRRELEIDQSEAVASVIQSIGLSPAQYRDYLSGAGQDAWAKAQREAGEDHVFGVPLFLFKGEPFWGHDRLPLLEQRLAEFA